MGTFSDETAVRAAGEGTFEATIAEGWDIAGNANGGYLLAIAARAMRETTGRPDPVTITAHYLAPGRPGPAEVRAEAVRVGRRFATATASLATADRRLLQVVGTFGDLAEPAEAPERVDGEPPDLPPVEDCLANEPAAEGPPSFFSRVDLRLHPEDAEFRTGNPSGIPRMRGWLRLRDGEPWDTLGLLVAVDALPPTVFNARLPVAWTPTVELTAHVRARPAPGWLRCAFTTRFVTGGFLEEDGEVWDETGRLVAQSRQLALVPRG